MAGQLGKKAPLERSQKPLWLAIVGLLVSVSSFGLGEEQIANIVMWTGAVFAAIALIYYFFQPRHGF